MYALYDIDGILRFTGSDRETCMAYAELLEIASDEYCLLDLPGSSQLDEQATRQKRLHHRVRNNN